MPGAADEKIANLLWSILLPFYYPEQFRTLTGPGFQFDGVGAGLTGAGFNPVPLVFAAAFAYGLRSSRRRLAQTVPAFLLTVWAAVILTVGWAGPSPTRLLILFPVYAAFAAFGFASLIRNSPALRLPVAAVILAAGITGGAEYLSGPESLSRFYAAPATAIGTDASTMAAKGQRILCMISGEASVVRYLTYRQQPRIKIVEFYRRAPSPSEIPFEEFRGGALLIERAPQFAPFAARFPAEWVTHAERYDMVRLPSQ